MDNKILAVLAIAVVVVAGVGAFALMGDNSDPNKVTYDPNGGTQSSSGTYVSDKGVLSQCPFSKENRTFCYWNTQADGKGDSFNPGNPNDVEKFKTSDVTKLYAIWGYTLKVNIPFFSNTTDPIHLFDPQNYGLIAVDGAVTLLNPGITVGVPEADGSAYIAFYPAGATVVTWTYDASTHTFSAPIDDGVNVLKVKVTGVEVKDPFFKNGKARFTFDINDTVNLTLSVSTEKL